MSIDDDDRYERLRLAYHEAAHAVVGMKFGLPIERVEVGAEGGTYRHGFTPVPVGGTWEDAIMTLAGRFGETIITGERRDVTDEWLRFVIGKLRASDDDPRFRRQDDFIVMRIVMAGEPDEADEELIESYRAWEEEAEAIVADPMIRAQIETLADALVRRGALTEEAKGLIDESREEPEPM